MAVVHNMTICPRALFEWAAANSNLQVLETVFPYEDREALELLMRNPECVGASAEVDRINPD